MVHSCTFIPSIDKTDIFVQISSRKVRMVVIILMEYCVNKHLHTTGISVLPAATVNLSCNFRIQTLLIFITINNEIKLYAVDSSFRYITINSEIRSYRRIQNRSLVDYSSPYIHFLGILSVMLHRPLGILARPISLVLPIAFFDHCFRKHSIYFQSTAISCINFDYGTFRL